MPTEDIKPENTQNLKTINLIISGRRTSMRLEPVMWEALSDICSREMKKLSEICELIDQHKGDYTLTSTLRLFMVCYFRSISKKYSPFLSELPTFVDKAIKGEMDLVEKKSKVSYNPQEKKRKSRGKAKNVKICLD